eukprot:scaffold106285_cov69-Phaeocystis_antarctica.AAC.1
MSTVADWPAAAAYKTTLIASPTGRVEGARSTASDWWTSHPLRASLPALRRVGAADVSTLVLARHRRRRLTQPECVG